MATAGQADDLAGRVADSGVRFHAFESFLRGEYGFDVALRPAADLFQHGQLRYADTGELNFVVSRWAENSTLGTEERRKCPRHGRVDSRIARRSGL